jgi:hypothetical protein
VRECRVFRCDRGDYPTTKFSRSLWRSTRSALTKKNAGWCAGCGPITRFPASPKTWTNRRPKRKARRSRPSSSPPSNRSHRSHRERSSRPQRYSPPWPRQRTARRQGPRGAIQANQDHRKEGRRGAGLTGAAWLRHLGRRQGLRASLTTAIREILARRSRRATWFCGGHCTEARSPSNT